jgi:hypothetical protein
VYFVDITYRQRLPNGVDAPRDKCERTLNGPFATRESAERYAASVANQTAVLQATIVEKEGEANGNC